MFNYFVISHLMLHEVPMMLAAIVAFLKIRGYF